MIVLSVYVRTLEQFDDIQNLFRLVLDVRLEQLHAIRQERMIQRRRVSEEQHQIYIVLVGLAHVCHFVPARSYVQPDLNPLWISKTIANKDC